MKPFHPGGIGRGLRQMGSALVTVLVMTATVLVVVVGALGWSRANVSWAARSNQYLRSQAAAEAATEKLIARVGADYQNQGVKLVHAHLDQYRNTVPENEYSYWSNYEFRDEKGVVGRTTVDWLPLTTAPLLSLRYQGLRGFAYDMRIVAYARELNTPYQNISGRVEQHLELAVVPIFQYAIFYDRDLEFNRCAPMQVSGPVHCNANIYGAPASSLAFYGQVTAAGKILIKQKKPGDPQTLGSGTTTFHADRKEGVPTLNLPLGTNNTAEAARQVIEIPPWMEKPESLLGQVRYYNLADMVVMVDNTNVVVSSGYWNSFSTSVPWQEASNFVKTNATMYDDREDKTVMCTDLDVNQLRVWNNTNGLFNPNRKVQTVYIADLRTPPDGSVLGGVVGGVLGSSPTYMKAVRLVNGEWLPAQGLTVATPNPMYIVGHYNVTTNGTPVNLGTANTSRTLPASIAADALTILSEGWVDSDGTQSLNSSARRATATTVNTAILVGNTETTSGYFGGGVHNLPRYLESWSGVTFTLNTSLVSMFQSLVATGPFIAPGSTGEYYTAPNRNWTFDLNFNDPAKLPPATPQIRLLMRAAWSD